MESLVQVELTLEERDMLLRGLRYVRSSVMLEMRDPTPEDTYRRSHLLDQLQNLAQRLENAESLGVPV